MKNKLIIIIVAILIFTSGCGANNFIKDKDKKIVQYAETGQNLQNNILCKPDDESDLYKLYKEYDSQLKISLKKLPSCDKFKITSNKSKGIWEFLFVKPLAYILLKVGKLVKNMGLSVIIIGLLIRLVLLPFAYKTQTTSKKMQKVQAEMQKLEFKYRGRDDKESMMLKSQEMMEIYKKNGVKPASGCLLAFIQLPVFFAFLQAINRVPAIFEDKLFGFNLGMTPYVGLTKGNYWYIILILLIAASTYFSFKYSMKSAAAMSNNGSNDQMKMMTNIMVIMIVITSMSLSTALAFYWIITYAFIALQTFIFKKLSNDKPKDNLKDNKKKKDKIKSKLEMKEGLKYGSNK